MKCICEVDVLCGLCLRHGFDRNIRKRRARNKARRESKFAGDVEVVSKQCQISEYAGKYYLF